MPRDPYSEQRLNMVGTQLRRRGIFDDRVLSAMEKVPRHLFVPEALRDQAYSDDALPVDCRQTISQPFIVGYMLHMLEVSPEHRVLEIGTGTGYQAALLAEIAREVYTVERIPELAAVARRILSELGYTNVSVTIGDGTNGLPDHAPFDRIIVAAAAPQIPQPLFAQLTEGGRMVIPVGSPDVQQLVLIRKQNGTPVTQELEGCRFVPLLGEQGFTPR
jgi:protein-L-isoaspartate(D-aspartate) O-methyltransferase